MRVAALALLGGCFPGARALEEGERFEALRLGVAYEAAYGARFSFEQWDCLYGVGIVVSTSERDGWCSGARACYLDDRIERRRGVMIFADELDTLAPCAAGQLLRHELLHRLLECVEGDGDHEHRHPAWAGGSTVPAPNESLVASAASIDVDGRGADDARCVGDH